MSRPLIYKIYGYRIDTNDILLINPRDNFIEDMKTNQRKLPESPKLRIYITDKYIDTHFINNMSIAIASAYLFIELKNIIESIMELERVKSLNVIVYTDNLAFKNIRRVIISAINAIRKEIYKNCNKRFGITYINRFDIFSIGDTRYVIHSNGKVIVYEKNAYKEYTLISNADLPILYKNNQFDTKEYIKYNNKLNILVRKDIPCKFYPKSNRGLNNNHLKIDEYVRGKQMFESPKSSFIEYGLKRFLNLDNKKGDENE